MAPTFSAVSGDFLAAAVGFVAAAIVAMHVRTCFKFCVFPEPERPMKTMDWSFLEWTLCSHFKQFSAE
jgi:hypothetical protein